MVVDAPRVAAHAHPGQFVIVRATSNGERIPLTISHWARDIGSIELVVQAVGRTTRDLVGMRPGDALADVLGPLGRPTEIDSFGTVAVVAGGVGAAIALPVAYALAAVGNDVVGVLGARSSEHLILVPEFSEACAVVHLVTEDGSSGRRGLVTDELSDLITRTTVDRVFTVGPIAMMRAVAEVTRPVPIPTVASLNPIMVDGTGMCGGCRVNVAGVQRFACVDGPEFDAHAVDFDGLEARNRAYRRFEECQLALTGVQDG